MKYFPEGPNWSSILNVPWRSAPCLESVRVVGVEAAVDDAAEVGLVDGKKQLWPEIKSFKFINPKDGSTVVIEV